jgi:hypothetical protein
LINKPTIFSAIGAIPILSTIMISTPMDDTTQHLVQTNKEKTFLLHSKVYHKGEHTVLQNITTFFMWSTFIDRNFSLIASTGIFSTTEKSKKGINPARLSIFIVWYILET